MSREDEQQIIPDTIYDNNTKIAYKKGRFFGKGGFAKCYEITNSQNMQAYAGKIVSKKLLGKDNHKEKMTQEIEIHQSLKHKNVVGFYSFFEDQFNIYIVLELCRKRSMMELHKRRKAITEPETRFYLKQILNGVNYLHQRRIIHRDLKLGNLFLNDELIVKIGDFGLAAKIEYDGERKKTLCGTPNYIAPEILYKKGHSFEVDIWSIGCIMYTLLIGRPPFESNSLKETYSRIKKCEYKIHADLNPAAKNMIMTMLQSEPKNRPKVCQLLLHDFIINGYCPTSLPVSCLTMAPRFNNSQMISSTSLANSVANRKPLSAIVNNNGDYIQSPNSKQSQQPGSISTYLAGGSGINRGTTQFDAKDNLVMLRSMLLKVLKRKHLFNNKQYNYQQKYLLDEMTDPQAQPIIWISKWVDYSDKYGFGYQLSDEGVGVMFNDTTRLIMLPNGINVHYVDKNGEESYMTVDNYPRQHDKKMKLLSYFSRYMREHLIKTGASIAREADSMSRTPHLHQWCRSTSGVLMQLNNGTVQVNFSDHTKIIMCSLMAAITYIDEDKSFRTFRFSTIEENGCSMHLYDKMRYAFDKITTLLEDPNHLEK